MLIALVVVLVVVVATIFLRFAIPPGNCKLSSYVSSGLTHTRTQIDVFQGCIHSMNTVHRHGYSHTNHNNKSLSAIKTVLFTHFHRAKEQALHKHREGIINL